MKEQLTKLEIGCGKTPTPGYLHQDITMVEGTQLDFICNPWEIPIANESLDEVIALGVVEHLRFQEVDLLLSHILKILKKNGKFIFDVPDMKIWSEYLYNMTHDNSKENPCEDKHVWSTIYGWQRWNGDEHKCGWTKPLIILKVKEMGFSSVTEGVEVFTSKGFVRGRFSRPWDAHIYISAEK